MKKRKLLPVLLVLLLLLLAAGAALLFAGGEQDNSSGVDESVTPSPLLLQASQNRFRVYKGAQTELTVTSREVAEGTVTITDELGETVLTLELKDGTATGNLGVFEESPRCIQLTASMGEEQSEVLNLYVVPEVTTEMIATGIQVAQDLGRELIAQGFTAVDMDAVEAAKIWLEADERVEATVSMDNGVFYYTTDGIAGTCLLTPEEGALGGGTLFTQEENEVIKSYADWETNNLKDFVYLWSDDTLTNNKILVLRPMFDSPTEVQKRNPCNTETHANIASEVADAMAWGAPEVYSNWDAVEKITSGTMNEYGVLILNTHGVMLGKGSVKEQMWSFMLQDGIGFHAVDRSFMHLRNTLDKTLRIPASQYDLFYSKYSEDASANIDTAMLFINTDIGTDEAKVLEASGVVPETNVQLFGTLNLLRTYYQNKFFDNTMIYFGTCYSCANNKPAEFFLNRGAVSYTGYFGVASELAEGESCVSLFRAMIEDAPVENRKMNVRECAEKEGTIFTMIYRVIGQINESQWQMPHTLTWTGEYTFKGTGTLSGTVQMDQTGEPVGGALVELYRWLNQEFDLMGTTSTTGKGTFKVEDIPWGVYVVKVTSEEGDPAYADCILAAEEWDGGTIRINGLSSYYEYIRDELEPKLGLFEQGEKEMSVSDMNAQGWDMRTGILSAAIQDMNADGTDDMVLLRVEQEDRKGWNLQTLYADMYTMEKGKVVLKDNVKLDMFNNCEIHELWAAMYETDTGGYDLYVQSYAESVLMAGNDPIYSRYRFDGEALRKVFSIEQTEGGTTEKVYSGTVYNPETGKEESTTLWVDMMIWDFIGPGLYNSWGYADICDMYWHYLSENMAGKAPGDMYDYPSYIGGMGFESIAEVKNTGVAKGGLGGDFSMNVMDHTDLRGALEGLEK